MTIREALASRTPRVRKPHWANPNAYLRLPLRKNGETGPWAELYDDGIQQDVLEIRPGSQRIPLIGEYLDDGGYERYGGPISPFEAHKDNFARAYEEV